MVTRFQSSGLQGAPLGLLCMLSARLPSAPQHEVHPSGSLCHYLVALLTCALLSTQHSTLGAVCDYSSPSSSRLLFIL